MKKKEFTFETYNGKELLDNNKKMLSKLKDVIDSQKQYDTDGGLHILRFLDEESHVICMMDKEELLGFSWITLAEGVKQAELSWFYADRDKMKGLDAKKLFDKSIEYCRDKEIGTLKFNCSDAWSRVKNIDHLLESFGYTNSEYKDGYDVSIDILEK